MLDLSGPYRKTFDDMLPDATQVADPFHMVKLANTKFDQCRRRVQNATIRHLGRKHEPFYQARRLPVKAAERLDERGETKLRGLLEAGDPKGRCAPPGTPRRWCAPSKRSPTPTWRASSSTSSAPTCRTTPTRGRCDRWGGPSPGGDQIVASYQAAVSNCPTEAIINLIGRIKRIGFGFRSFVHYRLRVLAYAGRPSWALLATSRPAQIR